MLFYMSKWIVVSVIALGSIGSSFLSQRAVGYQSSGFELFGRIDGVETDGCFYADVKLTNRENGELEFNRVRFDVEDGLFVANIEKANVKSGRSKVEIEGIDAAEGLELVEFIELQTSTPGAVQTGHLNISGYVLAGRIGLGVSPTIARVQVNETGSAQGVRSITNSGTAVYGQATAGTGLAAGGYFTTSSIGGRAMVGDALSTTGATVGGLFYNRSTSGVALWGRHIQTTGASIGVYGQTGSSDGTAMVAENTSTGDQVLMGGNGTTLLTIGTLPKHRYTGTSAATMVPIAYGHVSSSGNAIHGSGNWIPTVISNGIVEIDILGVSGSTSNLVVVATPIENGGTEFCSIGGTQNADFRVNTYDVLSSSLVNSAFNFIVYRSGSYLPPDLPPAARKYGDIEAWQKADPMGFEGYRKASIEAERKANAFVPPDLPVDEFEPGARGLNRPE